MPGYLLAPCPDGHSGNARSRSAAASVHSCLVPSSVAYPLASHPSSSTNTYNGLSVRQSDTSKIEILKNSINN